jgi:hypothetical protein
MRGYLLFLLVLSFLATDRTSVAQTDDAIIARSVVTAGDTSRLQHALAKGRRGEPVTVGVIGGSITAGARASTPENQVDDRPAEVRDAWFDQTWGGYRQTNELARDLPPGRHRVVFEILAERNPQSTGHEYRILGLGAAGIDSHHE